MHAADHRGAWPVSVDQIVDGRSDWVVGPGADEFHTATSSYRFVGRGLTTGSPKESVIAYEFPGNHLAFGAGRIHLLLHDGTIRELTREEAEKWFEKTGYPRQPGPRGNDQGPSTKSQTGSNDQKTQ
jgi:hypothetical protein